jgi:hypothetical protein
MPKYDITRGDRPFFECAIFDTAIHKAMSEAAKETGPFRLLYTIWVTEDRKRVPRAYYSRGQGLGEAVPCRYCHGEGQCFDCIGGREPRWP